ASPSQIGRFETQWLATDKNLSALVDLSGQWIDLVHGRRPPRGIVFDMDSSVSPTHGEQENSVWNGHYACTCYHPLFVFNQFGDLERCALRPGNVHSADGWKDVLDPVVQRYRGKVTRIYFRADAAFAMPEVYEFLEAERIKYAIRLPANQVLQCRIGYLLKRPVLVAVSTLRLARGPRKREHDAGLAFIWRNSAYVSNAHKYGEYYWCVKTRVSEDGEISVHAARRCR